MKRKNNPLAVILTGAFLLGRTSVLVSGEPNLRQEKDHMSANDNILGSRGHS
jgi:hypothetical protein